MAWYDSGMAGSLNYLNQTALIELEIYEFY